MSTDGVILSNTMNYSVPVGEAAVKEAIQKMMPSRNLFSPRDFDVRMMPQQEYLHGNWLLTGPPTKGKEPRTFKSAKEVIAAYKRGDIDGTDPVRIDSE